MSSRIVSLAGGTHQLLVNGRPFLMRAAEVNNSSFSSPAFMRAVWPKLVENNVNTVLGAVSWDQIEPEEGRFDFNALDQVIRDARSHGLKLVLLWFGSFKNGLSTYVPPWVKKDTSRFPRAMSRQNETELLQLLDCLSVFHENSYKADAKAFAALLCHLRQVDEKENTIIMVQVENEVGLLRDSRDRCEAAEAAFQGKVPSHLIDVLQAQWSTLNDILRGTLADFHIRETSSSWEQVFGHNSLQTDEIFMAYHYARYLEEVASAGKAAYDIPLFTNTWLRNVPDKEDPASQWPALLGGGTKPGEYPSGGPVETVLDIWQLFAPSLDFIAPDIYLSHYEKTCAGYRHRRQPLFIPEQRQDEPGALRMWAAIGSHGALGVSPFGIDNSSPDVSPFTAHYKLLAQVAPQILQARADGRAIHGFFFDRFDKGEEDPSKPRVVQMGSWTLTISRAFVFGHPAPSYGMVIHQESDKFLLVGEGYQVSFKSTDPGARFSGILSVRELEATGGPEPDLLEGRWLNGDESSQGKAVIMPSESPDCGGFFISSWIPARTRIAECSVYSI
ncbi:glycoside hydrolase superfamily [Plectosphaerella plurivora]|uniref:Glycoside hydrolase superfamily n=1 Tax=Plectosphaerella plurivora TaxID=936078 RepID=A0A9P9A8N5_9PEZI|nr:glycoside hydrolase superfamily [Plectosphaerella plurivora]